MSDSNCLLDGSRRKGDECDCEVAAVLSAGVVGAVCSRPSEGRLLREDDVGLGLSDKKTPDRWGILVHVFRRLDNMTHEGDSFSCL